MIKKSCEWCGKEFLAHSQRRRTCCREHGHRIRGQERRTWDRTLRKKCPVCGKEFPPKTSHQILCSQSCCRVIAKKKIHANSLARKKHLVCIFCHKEFLVAQYKQQKYCSNTCATAFRTKKPFIKDCEWCKKEFLTKDDTVRFCSRSCSSHYRSRLPHVQISLRSPERREKIRLAKQNMDPLRKAELAEMSSVRMKANNPSQNSLWNKKAIATKRVNGTLTPFKKIEKGSNGRGPTDSENLLLASLGDQWEWNCVVKPFPGKRMKGFPTCYKIDVANPSLKIGIEIDGWSHNLPGRKEQDQRKTSRLTELGWRVLRFTNEEVMTKLSKVLLVIKKEIKAS